jgi:DNA-directed RNA polymerase specialized sigma24 family protein
MLDYNTIEESIQYARIEYWKRNIEDTITSESHLFAWFITVARRFLTKEVIRINRNCHLSNAMYIHVIDTVKQRSLRDTLDSIEAKYGQNATFAIKHANGFSLTEIAESEHISLDAVKQRHARVLKKIQTNEQPWYK